MLRTTISSGAGSGADRPNAARGQNVLEDRTVYRAAPTKSDSRLLLVGAMFVMDGFDPKPGKGLKSRA